MVSDRGTFPTHLSCAALHDMSDEPLPAAATDPTAHHADALTTPPAYLDQARQSSLAIQKSWIRSVLRGAAADALRTIVTERTLRQRRREKRAAYKHRYDDGGSVSSLEEEPANAQGVGDEGEEVEVTQADVDAAYALAERVGRKWAGCLREEEGLPSSADAVLEAVRAGKYLEAEAEAKVGESGEMTHESETGNDERSADAVADEPVVAAAETPTAVMEEESTPAHESEAASLLLCNLARPSDAITPEVAISRLVTPPALLIGTAPSFGTLADAIAPNPVLSASLVTTMLPTSKDEIEARTKEADAWRRNVAGQMGQIIERQRWLYPKSLLEKAVRHNRERMASSRVGASTTASIASGRAVAATDDDRENDEGPGRKRKRSDMANERANANLGIPMAQPRPPCPYSELEWTGCELSQEQRTKLDEELLHEIPEAAGDDGDGKRIHVPPPIPPSCIVGGHLQHIGSIQQWEKAGTQGMQVGQDSESDPMQNLQRAKTRRKRWYRQAKTERLGRRVERPNDARIEIHARLSKVVKATDGEKQQEEEADEAPKEYLEMDLGGCLLEVGADDDGAQTIVTFKSLELSLALNAEGGV